MAALELDWLTVNLPLVLGECCPYGWDTWARALELSHLSESPGPGVRHTNRNPALASVCCVNMDAFSLLSFGF